jgi:hypothetical protein
LAEYNFCQGTNCLSFPFFFFHSLFKSNDTHEIYSTYLKFGNARARERESYGV